MMVSFPDLMHGDRQLPLIIPVDLVGIDDRLDASEGQQLVDNLKRVLCGELVGQSNEGDLVGEFQALDRQRPGPELWSASLEAIWCQACRSELRGLVFARRSAYLEDCSAGVEIGTTARRLPEMI